MSYQIAWRNLKSGATGIGPKKWEDANEIEAVVDEMNAEYGDFEHTVVVSGTPPEFKSQPKAELRQDPFIVVTDSWIMPFGEHKGKPMARVPSRYLDWFLSWEGRHAWPGIVDYIERNQKSINQDLDKEAR